MSNPDSEYNSKKLLEESGLFLRGKKTIYLYLYEAGKKNCNVGFAQFLGSGDRLRLSLQIKKNGVKETGAFPILIQKKEEIVRLGHISLQNGSGTFEGQWNVKGGMIRIADFEIAWEEVESLQIECSNEMLIWGAVQNNMFPQKVRMDSTSEKRQNECVKLGQKAGNERLLQEMPELIVQENFCADKWEQLMKEYPNVHPFGDDRTFISIELKDFVIMEESCQRLVHNSFLLHGFYNYRHIILGKDKRLGSCEDTCFYLGVPGTFFEREKQVAIMFGFEGFESAGAVEVGKFGYYMREVFI